MKNKGIIILGAPATGKSTLIKELDLPFQVVNPDFLVEDKSNENCYNNPINSNIVIKNIILPSIFENQESFIFDTTGSNINTLRKITENPNYQFKAVIVYCNPIIAFIRNFSRERKLPKQVLLENWLKVYSQIDDYINMFGEDNIYIYETDYTEEEGKILKQYKCLDHYLDENKSDYSSTFKKETTVYTPEQIQNKEKQFINILDKVDFKEFDIQEEIQRNKTPKSFIKEELNKWIT